MQGNDPISEIYFTRLITDFQSNYLADKKYHEQIAVHRNPIEIKNETLSALYSYLHQIQSREEMRDIDVEKKVNGYVSTKVIDIWKSDKRIKSLYDSVKRYCEIRGKEFNSIAIHIAEYRAMNKLVGKINRSIHKENLSKKTPEIVKTKGTKKTRAKIPKENKIRAELQKQNDSICPFCDNDDVGHFQIHHIDHDPSNNDVNNLLLLCPNCHSKITKGDISDSEVIKKKKELLSKTSKFNRTSTKATNFNSHVDTAIIGDNNVINITQSKKKPTQKYPPGCIGYEEIKANYISLLIDRYNEYKKYEVGKENVTYAIFSSHLKKKFKIGATRTIYNLPVEKFGELAYYIQSRIDNTKLAKIKGKNHKNYSSFEEYEKDALKKIE